jgi:RNA polymerase sigma-70 factor (ECF subfamily)
MTHRSDGGPAREALADELLAVRCQLGEPEAFDALVERWHEPLWRYTRRLTDDDDAAADAVQDVWLRVLRALPGLRDPARLRPWLFGIARRTLMDRLRRRYAEPERVPVDAAEPLEPDADDDRAGELELVHERLAQLPLVEREVLVLFYLHELSLEQLAEVLGIPVGTVKSRLHRARRLLRRTLLEIGVER